MNFIESWKKLWTMDGDTWIPNAPGRCGGASAREVLMHLRSRLADKINAHDSRYGKGRKWDLDWQRHTRLFANEINTPRLRVYKTSAPLHFRNDPRFAHRWAEYGE